MEIIDQHIKEAEGIITSNDPQKAEEQYNKLFNIYSSKIENFEQGTSVLQSKMNHVWNLNGLDLPTGVNYIDDLKLLVEKIKMYNQECDMTVASNCGNNAQSQGHVTVTDNSIHIENSDVIESTIGHSPNKNNAWKTIGCIIAALAGIATIVAFILQLCGVL